MDAHFIQQNLLPAGLSYLLPMVPFEFSEAPSTNTLPKSRGRKKLRPGNPLKTEVLDKYWLRSFKNFVKSEQFALKPLLHDQDFWDWYISRGKPGKNTVFLSYNSSYKNKLFENHEFCAIFVTWGLTFGAFKLPVKVLKDSWEFYYEYLYNELIPRASAKADFEEIKKFYYFVFELIKQRNLARMPELQISDTFRF